MPDVAAGEVGDLFARIGIQVRGNAPEEGFDLGRRGRRDFEGLEAGLKTVLEIGQRAIAGAGDDNPGRQVVKHGE